MLPFHRDGRQRRRLQLDCARCPRAYLGTDRRDRVPQPRFNRSGNVLGGVIGRPVHCFGDKLADASLQRVRLGRFLVLWRVLTLGRAFCVVGVVLRAPSAFRGVVILGRLVAFGARRVVSRKLERHRRLVAVGYLGLRAVGQLGGGQLGAAFVGRRRLDAPSARLQDRQRSGLHDFLSLRLVHARNLGPKLAAMRDLRELRHARAVAPKRSTIEAVPER